MNNSNKNYISAGILILLGLVFLGREFNLIDFRWTDLARFWPVILILIGLNIILGGKGSGSFSWIFFALLIFAIPLGMVRKCDNKWDNHRNNWNDRYDNNDENDDDDDDDDDENEDNTKSESSSSFLKSQNFSEEMPASLKAAKLTMEGGIAGIDIDGTTTKLFEADTKSTFSNFRMSNKIENGVANLNFSMNENKGEKIEIDGDDLDGKNEAKIKLNPNVEWNMDYKFGIAGADLDLSPFNVKKLEIKTGVSGVDIKLGEKAISTEVYIEAGIAGINVNVPESAGVKIKADDFLNSNQFEDFIKDGSGYYLSPNYEKATKKITINYKGALSSFEVKRY
jgi:hypothetical protein